MYSCNPLILALSPMHPRLHSTPSFPCPQTAVDACLERVLIPSPSVSPCAFAVIFFEGHDPVAVQDALRSFADR